MALGYTLPAHGADSSFGGETYEAVVRFQQDMKAMHLYNGPIDGIAGHGTLTALNMAVKSKEVGRPKEYQKPPQPTASDMAALQGHDPKKLLFMSFDYRDMKNDYRDGFEEGFNRKLSESNGFPPTIYHLNSAREGVNDPGVIPRTVKAHVEKYGHLNALMVSGHGRSNHLGISAPLDSRKFLKDMMLLQTQLQEKYGPDFKLVDRIEFGACQVFNNLSTDDIRFYKDAAKKLGAEISGPTTLLYPTEEKSGARVIEFTPSGKVRYDPKRDDPEGYAIARQERKDLRDYYNNDRNPHLAQEFARSQSTLSAQRAEGRTH